VDGVNGFLRPIGDVEGMAQAAIRLLQNEEMYRQFSANSIERSCKTFCHETIASEYEALYAKLLG
ncbi:N-acetyl-alpha-D-glucosaminyl L-malate synthase BshA, partial [Mesorhizobium sp. M00.F.Ca.ET.186.01.1.1]